MKTLIVLLLLQFGFSGATFAQLKWFGKTMTVKKAEARWGRDVFDSKIFKEGDTGARAKMASSLIRNKSKWIGKSLAEIRKELGNHDGFYFSDMVPAYLISWGEKSGDEIWQIVFLPDADYRVKDIIIELNGS